MDTGTAKVVWLKRIALLTALVAAAVTGFIASGWGDPKAVGEVVWQTDNVRLEALPGQPAIRWLSPPLTAAPFSLRTTAVFQRGTPDSSAGLVLSDGERQTTVALSPLGYAAVQHGDGPDSFPWQPWPHVRTETAVNEIWIDVIDQTLTVRLNRELLWQGPLPHRVRQVGLAVATFQPGQTAVFTYPHIAFSTTAAP